MNNTNSLSHSRWECTYHVVWIPKGRRKSLYGQLRKNLGEVLHELARQKKSKVLEGHLQSDHIHMLVYQMSITLSGSRQLSCPVFL